MSLTSQLDKLAEEIIPCSVFPDLYVSYLESCICNDSKYHIHYPSKEILYCYQCSARVLILSPSDDDVKNNQTKELDLPELSEYLTDLKSTDISITSVNTISNNNDVEIENDKKINENLINNSDNNDIGSERNNSQNIENNTNNIDKDNDYNNNNVIRDIIDNKINIVNQDNDEKNIKIDNQNNDENNINDENEIKIDKENNNDENDNKFDQTTNNLNTNSNNDSNINTNVENNDDDIQSIKIIMDSPPSLSKLSPMLSPRFPSSHSLLSSNKIVIINKVLIHGLEKIRDKELENRIRSKEINNRVEPKHNLSDKESSQSPLPLSSSSLSLSLSLSLLNQPLSPKITITMNDLAESVSSINHSMLEIKHQISNFENDLHLIKEKMKCINPTLLC